MYHAFLFGFMEVLIWLSTYYVCVCIYVLPNFFSFDIVT
jgi:hypothetical protein